MFNDVVDRVFFFIGIFHSSARTFGSMLSTRNVYDVIVIFRESQASSCKSSGRTREAKITFKCDVDGARLETAFFENRPMKRTGQLVSTYLRYDVSQCCFFVLAVETSI